MAASVRESVGRVGFPKREEIAGEAGAAYLPSKAPGSPGGFLKSDVDEAESAQDKLEKLQSGREGM